MHQSNSVIIPVLKSLDITAELWDGIVKTAEGSIGKAVFEKRINGVEIKIPGLSHELLAGFDFYLFRSYSPGTGDQVQTPHSKEVMQ